MTDDPRSHQYNSADWEYEIDSVQRGGITGQTLARRHGKVSSPDKTDDHEAKDDKKSGSDEFGIPHQFKDD